MTDVLSDFSNGIAALVESAGRSVVRIHGRRRVPSSGIAFDASTIVTAAHTLHVEEGIEVALPDGSSVSARLVGADASTDLAVLRVEAALTPMTFSEAPLAAGHLVLALGRPGRSTRATLGIVSAAGGEWKADTGARIDRFIECDATLPPGFSGGPLVDVRGGAAGINTSRLTRGGTTIPIETVRRVVASIIEHGRVRRPRLGVGLYPIREGLIVMSVESGSAAATGGVLVGDVLQAIDERPLRHPSDLHDALREEMIGKEVTLSVVRAGEKKELRVGVSAA